MDHEFLRIVFETIKPFTTQQKVLSWEKVFEIIE